jgi:hypothetical protein
MRVRGTPLYLSFDIGAKFVNLALLQWAKDEHMESGLSEPGEPWPQRN